MNHHRNARLTIYGRVLLVRRILEHGLRLDEAAQAPGVSARTGCKWLRRYRERGKSGLMNRSSRPYQSTVPDNMLLSPDFVAERLSARLDALNPDGSLSLGW